MRGCYLILVVLLIAPMTAMLLWRSTLPTQADYLAQRRPLIDTRIAQLKGLRAKLPPSGSVKENTIPANLTPVPMCDRRRGECNLQVVPYVFVDALAAGQRQTYSSFPYRLSEVLWFTISQSLWPEPLGIHDPSKQRINDFRKTISKALHSRYLLVTRPVTRPTPRGPETVGIEGYLFDLQEEKLLGSVPYPAHLVGYDRDTHVLNRFLSQTLGGSFAPEYPMTRNVPAHDVELVIALAIVWTGVMVITAIISIPVGITLSRQHRRRQQMIEEERYPEELVCPRCGTWTDSLKHYRILRLAIFVGIGGAGQMETVTACPRCMRRHIRKRLLVNLLPGNLLMLYFGPALVFQYLRTFRKGHSPDAVEPPPPPPEQ